jgi:oligopeptide transport system permease protein
MILLLGVPIGVVAGYFGGGVDNVLMRVTDTVFAVPPILLTLVLVTLIGRDVWVVIFALGITSWPQLARVARAETLRLRRMEFVESARSVGASHVRVMIDHMLPNLLSSVVVTTVVMIPTVIITEATLTFLGIGVEASIPSWALMIRMAYQNMFSRPLLIIFPSAAISTLTLAFAFVGDGLRDALDPRLDDRI